MLKENLCRLRAYRGYSQEEIAEKIGISRQAYAKWETGATVPDIEKCQRLAEVYEVGLDNLVSELPADAPSGMLPGSKGKNIWGAVTLSDRGQLVIPKAAREHWNLSGGARLVVLSDDNEGFALVPAELFEERLKSIESLARKSAD